MGKGIPERRISNHELAGFLDTDNEWIVSRTGIENRYICTTETLTGLSACASVQALENAGMSVSDIDLVICATIGGDFKTPSLACSLSEQIGAKCPAFDINAACTGFIYALDVASGYLVTGKASNILIVCAEIMSTQVDWNDRKTCVLFGDGAAAAVVTSGDMLKYISLSVTADTSILNMPSSTGNSPYIKDKRDIGYLHMHGQEVFKFAVSIVGPQITQALDTLCMSAQNIDWYIIHQANKRIIDSIRTRLRQPEDKFPVNIGNYGNISSVSIPLLLYEMLEDGRLKRGDTLFLSAFGAGLTAGSCVFTWE